MSYLFLAQVLAFIAGVIIVGRTLVSTVQTFVLPRGVPDTMARRVFLVMRLVFNLRVSKIDTYEERDHIMAFYAPVSLIALTLTWLVLVLLSFTGIYWAISGVSLGQAFLISGSSLLTLGFATLASPGQAAFIFSEAAIGLLLAAVLITYLPTIYAAWSRREQAVAALEVRAGSPPSAWDLLARFHRLQRLEAIEELWPVWESWFLDVEESHTSLASLALFRSPSGRRSWVTAAGVVLDTAALMNSALEVPRDAQREVTLRAGYLALREIAAFFRIPFDSDPNPDDPISVTQAEFDEVYDTLLHEGLPMKPDREQAWRDFRGWRVNYDAVLVGLAELTMAPYAPWVSDRALHGREGRWLAPRKVEMADRTP